jgi:hypothetical protein
MMILVLCVPKRHIRIPAAVLIFVAGMSAFLHQRHPELIQYALQRGKSVAFIRGREALIINTGALRYNGNDYESVIKATLQQRGVKHCRVIVSSGDKYKYGALPFIRRDFPGCEVLAPAGVLPAETPHIAISTDTCWQAGDFRIILHSREDKLDICIAAAQDTIRIGDRDRRQEKILNTEKIPDTALHFVYKQGRWKKK